MSEYIVLSDCEVVYHGSILSEAKKATKTSWNKTIYKVERMRF